MSDTLRRALDGIERPLLLEPSVKFIGEAVRDGRFLVSFPRHALGPGPSRELCSILTELGCPPDALAALDGVQSRALSVHFGHEDDGTTKCYLEFHEADRPAPDLVFLAAKWRGDTYTLSHYLEREPATGPNLIADILPDTPACAALTTLTPSRLLEVVEPGTPRRSVDVNLSGLRATLGDHAETLKTVCGPVSEPFLVAHATDTLGHVAAGTARDGQPFTTLYFGAHRVTGPL